MRRACGYSAAHALPTPLTNLQGYLEAPRDGVMTSDRATFESLHEELDRMVRLSRSIDALSEGDVAARGTGELREIDLRAAIVAAVELYSAALERRGLAIEVDLPAAIRACAD